MDVRSSEMSCRFLLLIWARAVRSAFVAAKVRQVIFPRNQSFGMSPSRLDAIGAQLVRAILLLIPCRCSKR
jgi:hypothetical protein